MDGWMAPIGFGTLLVAVAGFGLALVKMVRSMRKSNEAAHAKTEQRIDSSRAEVLGQVQAHDEKNTAKLDAIARDVAFLAGRQAERDQRDGG